MSPPEMPDTDPADPFRSRAARRAVWNAWEASNGTLDDLPAGLVSATLDAAAMSIGRMEMPAPMREPTGLEVRGG